MNHACCSPSCLSCRPHVVVAQLGGRVVRGVVSCPASCCLATPACLGPRTLLSEAVWTSVSFSSESSIFGSDPFGDRILIQAMDSSARCACDMAGSLHSEILQLVSCVELLSRLVSDEHMQSAKQVSVLFSAKTWSHALAPGPCGRAIIFISQLCSLTPSTQDLTSGSNMRQFSAVLSILGGY